MKKLSKIRNIFKNSASPNKTLAIRLIERAEFMESVLSGLQAEIQANDPQTKSGALHSYNTTMRNYQSTIKLLNDMLPVHIEEKSDDEFEL